MHQSPTTCKYQLLYSTNTAIGNTSGKVEEVRYNYLISLQLCCIHWSPTASRTFSCCGKSIIYAGECAGG